MKLSNIVYKLASFKVICLCVIKKLLRAFAIIISQKATHLKISENWRCINFSSSTPVRRLLCSKSPRKFVQTLFFTSCSETTIYWPRVHSVTHGQLWKPQHTYMYVRRGVRNSHFKTNRAFKVIQCHPYWQKSRTGCWHNVQHVVLICEIYSIGKTANSSISTTPLLYGNSYLRKAFEYCKEN